MKKNVLIYNLMLAFVLVLSGTRMAAGQGGGYQNGLHAWPDTLEISTVTGTIVVDESGVHPNYFLDVTGDDVADYHVSFGPWWYQPESLAERPSDGDTVTLTGALYEGDGPLGLTSIIVFEIDGVLWRVAVEYGQFGWNAEPAWVDPASALTVSGVVFVDTTYFYRHYYLDTDGDTLPEYQLGFGPPWYEPESGAVRPDEGEEVTVTGLLHLRDGLDLLAVVELDGEVWRPLDDMAPWSGDWMHRSHMDSVRVFCVNNELSWINFPPGNFGMGMMGGHMWPDSVFVQFWEIHPDSLPAPVRDRTFIGYHLNLQDRDRDRLMDGRFGGNDGQMRFEQAHRIRINYLEEDIASYDLIEETVTVLAWDEGTGDWVEINDATIDTEANTLTFESADLYGYYALAGDARSTGVEEIAALPRQAVLHVNYPNPFNPSTTIAYELLTPQHVTLEVFDVTGRSVAKLVDVAQAAGRHEVVFDARDLASGVYVYRLRGAGIVLQREMVLMK